MAVIIGSVTHVLWDEFTHPGRLGTTWFLALAGIYPSPVGPLEGFRYLQYASGVFGLAALAWVFMHVPKRAPEPRKQARLAAIAPAALLGAGLLTAGTRLAVNGSDGWRSIGFDLLTSFIAGSIAAAAMLSLAHGRLQANRPRRS